MAAHGWRAVCACEGRRPSLPDSGAWRRKASCVFPSPSPPPAREDAPRPRDAPAGCRGSGRGRRGGCLSVLRAGTRQRQTLGRGTWATARGRHAGSTRPRAQRGAPGARPRSAARPPKLGERAGGARKGGGGGGRCRGRPRATSGSPPPWPLRSPRPRGRPPAPGDIRGPRRFGALLQGRPPGRGRAARAGLLQGRRAGCAEAASASLPPALLAVPAAN